MSRHQRKLKTLRVEFRGVMTSRPYRRGGESMNTYLGDHIAAVAAWRRAP